MAACGLLVSQTHTSDDIMYVITPSSQSKVSWPAYSLPSSSLDSTTPFPAMCAGRTCKKYGNQMVPNAAAHGFQSKGGGAVVVSNKPKDNKPKDNKPCAVQFNYCGTFQTGAVHHGITQPRAHNSASGSFRRNCRRFCSQSHLSFLHLLLASSTPGVHKVPRAAAPLTASTHHRTAEKLKAALFRGDPHI